MCWTVLGIMSAEVIYTASDLDRKRREVTDAARRGLARIRDTDGMGLVLLPAPHDFGDLTWLRYLDDDDLTTFIAELRAAVSVPTTTMTSPNWSSLRATGAPPPTRSPTPLADTHCSAALPRVTSPRQSGLRTPGEMNVLQGWQPADGRRRRRATRVAASWEPVFRSAPRCTRWSAEGRRA
jgi:hypothetical protein